MRKRYFFAIPVILLIASHCRKPFSPEEIAEVSSALIVEGIINTSGPTSIYLGRTLPLSETISQKHELKAQVQVISENNVVQNLVEQENGRYYASQLVFDTHQKYRLSIKTAAGEEYLSEPMPVLNTPPIDSVNWVREPDGVGIYVNTHDDQNNTRYYRWDFEEDWELRSIAASEYRIIYGVRTVVVPRDKEEIPLLYTCWKNQRSTNILISSTAKLKSDVVYRYPIVFIPNVSDKLDVKYSVLVKQYAISFEAYEYLNMMKKNTEQVGSFFDPQPFELIGNIRSVSHPDEPVIGFIGIASVREKRIFINRADVPNWDFLLSCRFKTVKNHVDTLDVELGNGSGFGVANANNNGQGIESYNAYDESCLDCRIRGGNNNKPAFW